MKILVLNLIPNTIGDSIIMLPMFSIIKKNFPQSTLVVTTDEISKELFSYSKDIDELIVIKELSSIGDQIGKFMKILVYLKMVYRISKKLRAYRFDLCFVGWPNFFIMPLIPYLAGIRDRIGFTYPGSVFSFLLTKKIAARNKPIDYYDRHIVENFLDLLRAENLKFVPKDVVCRIEVKDSQIQEIKSKLKKKSIYPNNKKIVSLHTTARHNTRSWPRQKFIELIGRLLKKDQSYIFFLHGAAQDKEYNEEICKIDNSRIFNFCGELSLREVGEVLKISDLFIGNDSGLAHYSSAVGTTSIVLFGAGTEVYGATPPVHSKPIGTGKVLLIEPKVKNRKKSTVDLIEVDEVYKKIEI